MTRTVDGVCENCGGDKRRRMILEWMPATWIVALALALGAATIVIASAYGAIARIAAYVGGAVAFLILAWGLARDRD